MTLTIISPTFNTVSETFIRRHVNELRPGETSLVSQYHSEGGDHDCPHLRSIESWNPPVGLVARTLNFSRRALQKVTGPSLSHAATLRFVQFLLEQKTSVVLAEYGPTGCLVHHAVRKLGLPLYVHFHGYDASQLIARSYWRRQYRHLFASANGIVAPSQFLADRLISAGCPTSKISVVPYGVRQSAKITRRQNGRVLAVGRLVEKKAPQLTIAAFARIAPRAPDAHLHMVGDGPLLETCRAAIRGYGLENRITLHGALPNTSVQAHMNDASIFVQHSVTATTGDTEGLPVAILEAMSLGIPVVATRHAGIPESVIEGETGFLVDEGDVEGMADSILRLLNDNTLAERLGSAGRQRFELHFTLQKSTDRLRQVLGLSGRRAEDQPENWQSHAE